MDFIYSSDALMNIVLINPNIVRLRNVLLEIAFVRSSTEPMTTVCAKMV